MSMHDRAKSEMTGSSKIQSRIPYLPHTEDDRQSMLESLSAGSFEDLIAQVPKELRAAALEIREGLAELELTEHLASLARKNIPATQQACFLGGGSYNRFVPAVVPQIASRSEFATAYTPYQPEVSQGSLQVIYEFQSAICLLTGMDVANASMYDGPTACAEAGLMAARLTGRKKLKALMSVGPEYRMVTHAYAKACGLEWSTIPCPNGAVTTDLLELDQDTAALIVQYPNFFGCIEDLEKLSSKAKDAGALLIVVSEPISLALLTPPGDFSADIVVGDTQPCGNYLSFGGPSAGYMACKKEYIRQLPGRLAGMTLDKNGKRAFTLTLQTREQHIRRARATSNICTNQALNALSSLVYFSMLGKSGLYRLAEVSVQRAHYLAERLRAAKIEGIALAFEQPFFNEFVLSLSENIDMEKLLAYMRVDGILAGVPLGPMYGEMSNCLLVAVTERNSPEQLDRYVSSMHDAVRHAKESRSVLTGASVQSSGQTLE